MNTPRTADRWVVGSSMILAAVFYGAVIKYAINVPQVDDYLYVDSVRRIMAVGTPFTEILRLLVEQHNDHRILLSRLLVLADYMVEGQVNYRTLTLLGSLSIAALGWQVYRLFKQAGLPIWTILPVVLLLFQPSYQEDVWWVLCLLQHTVTLLLMLIVFRLLTKPEPSAQTGALILGSLVLYSNSNGLFMWIAVVSLLLLMKKWRWAIVWAITGGLLIGLYFGVDYRFIAKESMTAVSQHPGWVVKSIISFAGSAVYFDQRRWLIAPGQWVVLGLGVVVLISIGLSWVRLPGRLARRIPSALIPFLGLSLVLLGSGAAAALARSDGNLMVISRYQLYAVWCLIVVYALLIMQLTGLAQKALAWVSLGFTCWFWLNSWLYYGPLLADRYSTQIAEGVALKQYNYSVISQTFGLDPYWQRGWVAAMKQGIYRVPDLPEIRGIEQAMQRSADQQSTARFSLAIRRLDFLKTDAMFIEQDTLAKPEFLYLRSVSRWYVFPAQRMPKPIMKPWLPSKGVKTMLLPVMLQPGTYRFGWVRQGRKSWSATATEQELQVPIQ